MFSLILHNNVAMLSLFWSKIKIKGSLYIKTYLIKLNYQQFSKNKFYKIFFSRLIVENNYLFRENKLIFG